MFLSRKKKQKIFGTEHLYANLSVQRSGGVLVFLLADQTYSQAKTGWISSVMKIFTSFQQVQGRPTVGT